MPVRKRVPFVLAISVLIDFPPLLGPEPETEEGERGMFRTLLRDVKFCEGGAGRRTRVSSPQATFHRSRHRPKPGDVSFRSLSLGDRGVAGADVTPVRVVRVWALQQHPPRRFRLPRSGTSTAVGPLNACIERRTGHDARRPFPGRTGWRDAFPSAVAASRSIIRFASGRRPSRAGMTVNIILEPPLVKRSIGPPVTPGRG